MKKYGTTNRARDPRVQCLIFAAEKKNSESADAANKGASSPGKETE
jgi:hypothetical protein